ncbi:YveK family protein [Paenibacillus sp. OV219]|uniref:YveK family protein n=1 Tax=Paenibacillus sp. OV219 TaxID=1884377 RepID=UPI0008BE4970|nr:Wzz/FepE/Etk N-terminal domain-containing protein [Paenibacillus sp. OV219]SEO63831.1 Capsular polysaccharide biosynthesis protein [Paenibacillus sp. OV219]
MELKELLSMVRKRLLLISLFVIVACGLMGVKSYLYTVPVYKASAKLIVSQSFEVNGTRAIDWNVMQSNIKLISSYKEIIDSSTILNKVISNYPELKASPSAISSVLKVSSASDSQVMNIEVTDTSYKRAANIVNAVAHVFKSEIPSIMKVDNVTILSDANVEAEASPINRSPIFYMVLSFIVSLMLSIGFVFLLDYFDDTIKNEEDVLQSVELPMLSYITKINRSDLKPRKLRASEKKVGDGTYVTARQ